MSDCRRNIDLPRIDVLVASLFYLMTRHSIAPSRALADSIADHFQMLRHHPDCNDEVIAVASGRLTHTWSAHAQRCSGSKQAAEARHLH